MIVVIPTARTVRLDYLAPLIETGARFIVVDDSEGSVRIDHPQFRVFHWGDRRRMLGRLDERFPRRNGACRDFGFYVAWHEADADEIIVALDDDCLVDDKDYSAHAQDALSARERPVAAVPDRHLNIIDLYLDVPPDLFPRGFPYSARLARSQLEIGPPASREVKFSLGLWNGVFDVNAIDKLSGPAWVHPDARLRHASVVIEPGNLVSVCSMNMQFRHEVLPAVYQLPMNVPALPGWVVDRYGDIWGGFILKILMDRRGDALAVGSPMIRHMKDRDDQRNIWQEHVCHLLNDEFIELLWRAGELVRPAPYLEMMQALAQELRSAERNASPLLRTYFAHLLPALDAWTAALGSPSRI